MDDADIYAAAETPYQRDENNYWGILDNEEEDEGDLGDLGDDPFDTAQILEQNAQQWVNLVETSGGIMAFHKCLWQIVSYYACNGWMLVRSHTQINYEMTLRNGVYELETKIAPMKWQLKPPGPKRQGQQ